MTQIIGLPDGGAGIVFPDHPAHHNKDGTIQVTWSAETLRAMTSAAQESLETEEMIIRERPDTDTE